MTSKNDITGDDIKSKTNSEKYRDGWNRIFGNKPNRKIETPDDCIKGVIESEDQTTKPDNAPLR